LKRVVLGAASGLSLGVALVVRSTIRAPIFDGSDPASPARLLSSLPGAPVLVLAVVLGALAGGLLGSRGRERFVTPFLASGLAAGVFFPGAFSAAPFLASFWGSFLDLVLAISVLLVLGRIGAELFSMPRWLGARAVGLCGLALYLAVGLTLSREVGLSGDEPHYLLVTESLLKDGDIRVQNNYANEDYRRFYVGKIGPHLAAGTEYSVHGVLVSLLMLPGFALGGLDGVVVTEALLAALLLQTIYRMASELTRSPRLGLFAAAGFGLTAPGLFLGVSVYPEVPAALVVALVSRRLLDDEPPGRAASACWALIVGALPFLHVKFVPLAAILAGALLSRYRQRSSFLHGFLAGTTASVAAVLVFSYVTMGSFDPTAAYGHQRIFVERVPLGIGGLLFDQEFGLLPSAPVYLLGLVGLVSLSRRHRLLGVVATLSLFAVMLPGAAHPLWTGGNAPPARFLFPALPLLLVAAACLLDRGKSVVGWAPPLLATSLGISGAMLLLPGQPLYLNARDGTGQVWEALSSAWDVTDYLPSLVVADTRSIVWASVLGAVLLLLVLEEWSPFRRRLPSSSWKAGSRLPHAAWCVLAAAWIQDATGVPHSRAFQGRWALEVMHRLAHHVSDRFVELPSFSPLGLRDLQGRVALPLEPDPEDEDGDARQQWSRSYALPAGGFAIRGVARDGVALCNGEGCFSSGRLELHSAVQLSQFRLRAMRWPAGEARLFLLAPASSPVRALRTAALSDDLLLHGLDDEAYLDPTGFWVKASGRAAFALESAGAVASPLVVRLANGGAENRVVVRTPDGAENVPLAPWEERDVAIRGEGAVRLFTVESEKGFRPSDLDPASGDNRALGVRLPTRRPFD
jgi:hypothetical protein